MADVAPQVVELTSQDAIAVRGRVPVDALTEFFGRAFTEAAQAAAETGVEIVGPAFGFYPEPPGADVVVEAGFPVSAPAQPHGDAHPMRLPGGRAVEVVHVGPYDTLEVTYAALQTWMAGHGHEPSAAMWESYLSDPEVEPDPSRWRTKIVVPIR